MKKYENFERAFINLKDIYKYEEPYNNVILTGLVGLYEICFEQAWKTMKEILEEHGFHDGKTGSPRMIVKTAFAAGMINDEEKWLDALVSRNNVSHAYNIDIAIDIIEKTKLIYIDLFSKLKEELQKNWL